MSFSSPTPAVTLRFLLLLALPRDPRPYSHFVLCKGTIAETNNRQPLLLSCPEGSNSIKVRFHLQRLDNGLQQFVALLLQSHLGDKAWCYRGSLTFASRCKEMIHQHNHNCLQVIRHSVSDWEGCAMFAAVETTFPLPFCPQVSMLYEDLCLKYFQGKKTFFFSMSLYFKSAICLMESKKKKPGS